MIVRRNDSVRDRYDGKSAGARRLGVGLARITAATMIAGLAASSLVLASPANAADASVMVKTQRMKDANLNSGQEGWYEKGANVTLSCWKRGQAVKGFFSFNIPNGGWDNLWYQTSDGHFVADVDIQTGTLNAVGSECGVAPAPTGPAPGGASAPVSSGRTTGGTQQSNPFTGNLVGYCTYGAQEQVKQNAGYYIAALTGNAMDWDDQARRAGWTVVSDAQPRSLVVFEPSVVGGVGHVAWVTNVEQRGRDRYLTITEMNYGPGATEANAYRTTGFNQFHSRSNVKDVPGMSYILIP